MPSDLNNPSSGLPGTDPTFGADVPVDEIPSFLQDFLKEFKSSDYWFLRRKFNPAHGLFANMAVTETSANTLPIEKSQQQMTLAMLLRPNGLGDMTFGWGDDPALSMSIDSGGNFYLQAGSPFTTDRMVEFNLQLPVNRLSFLVVSVHPGKGLLRYWRNGKPFPPVRAVEGLLLGNSWANTTLNSVLSVSGESPLIANRVQFYLNQVPRAFN